MKIETIYNIDDVIWILNDKEPCRGKIKEIKINVSNKNGTQKRYLIDLKNEPHQATHIVIRHELQTFKTKRDLIESLFYSKTT